MFETFERSWSYAKASYAVLWDHKRLIVFPILSAVAAIVVTAAFAAPLWQSGTLEAWAAADEQAESQRSGSMYVTAFLFYFANYFVIVFFNAALIASTMQAVNGQIPALGYGLAAAGKRLPQILGWALISAVVGVVLRTIEGSNKRAAAVVSMILGSAWTALSFFVVPVIVIDGLGPIAAFKRSIQTLRTNWGTALVGTFSLGLLGFLLCLPVFLVAGLLFYVAAASESLAAAVLLGAAAVALVVTGAAAGGAASTIFKALLFSYTVNRSALEGIDTSEFAEAFASRDR